MVRVTFCLTSLIVGGTELNAVRTAEGLDRKRFHLTVVALSDEGPLLERYRAAGYDVRVFDTPSFYSPKTIPEMRKLVRFLKENRTQVLHAHSIYANVIGVTAGRLAGVPCIISSRRWWKRGVSPALNTGNHVADRLAHRVLANSQGVARLVEADGIAPSRVAVIPNFVDAQGFEMPTSEALTTLRAQLGLHPGEKALGVVARLAGVKDHRNLVEAFSRIANDHPDWVLSIVGDGVEREALELQVQNQGLGDRVRFAGSMPHQPSPHHAFELSVLNSISEGFPNSLVEAMAARRAVVATDVGGNPDAVEDGVTGLLVAPQNPGELARALSRLMGDDVARERMGKAGYETARSRFSRNDVLGRLEALYHEVLGTPVPQSVSQSA